MTRSFGRLGRIAALSWVLLACKTGEATSEPAAPPRPSGVPEHAIWAGGMDGGEFLLISPAKADGSYPAKIYNDHSGELEFNGLLRLDKPGGKPIDVKDPKVYSDWDGDVLSLRDGRVLRPLQK
jgi:hypothetical protein